MPNFTHAIVRTPCPAVVQGITSNPQLGAPDYEKALLQHAAYVKALESCGLAVTQLAPEDAFPDSCFVEDTAVLSERCAVITLPGAQSRAGEAALMAPTIAQFYPAQHIHTITAPGTLEGGDVMRVGDCFYVGASARTNAEGIRQFAAFLAPYGYTAKQVPLRQVLHLKTGVNYLEDGNMLVSGEFVDAPQFTAFHREVIPAGEEYAANSLWVNGRVLVPEGYPKTRAIIEGLGYAVLPVDTGEFAKIDGGLSCLSLRFAPGGVG
ncbi:N(G),N(G)-dimethylarginine dimethylaminohydrolase [Ruminococcaceae bacterium OttesenSCG-928-O06]|nr:N(G),N(G)-dimethylarginine dimethylaminohydrolase [Ruminococcaceae bacterium OttesenSCG-928-O06]